MFGKILIANRGEIACRVIKTARRLGVRTVAVHSDADRDALHVRLADEAVRIGPAPASQSYLLIERIVAAAKATGAEAVHPGYGFLSERAAFPAALAAEGIAFIGPPPAAIEAMGDKIASKRLAAAAGVSTVPGFLGEIGDEDEAARIAAGIGYPVMIKASAGGGGKGMRIAFTEAEAREGFARARSEAGASFGDDRVFIEKFVTSPRHIEIQVLGDRHGTIVHLGERECSIQRRNQKVIEEAPSPFLDAATRAAMGAQAVALAAAVGYHSAGTVEFIVDAARNFYFLEMNTRLQVEHPVTELVTGLDLVELMIRVAAGERLPFGQADVRPEGWAMESRLYAEDPYRGFLPSTGRLTRYRPPAETEGYRPGLRPAGLGAGVVRTDTGVEEGGEISRFYDPMIAKLCTWGPDRASAIEGMRTALDGFEVEGIGHNLPFLQAVMDHPRFVAGRLSTAFIAEEWPEGFHGVDPAADTAASLAVAAACMWSLVASRAGDFRGILPERRRPVPADWVVSLAGRDLPVRVTRTGYAFRATEGGRERAVLLDWEPGRTIARVREDATALGEGPWRVLKVSPRTEGFRLRWRGTDVAVTVRSPRAAELAALMPAKEPPDTSKVVLCPMPGLVVSIAVAEGQEVQEGQALCTVEAMKMENVLRAERRAVVKRIAVSAGASLAVDDLIMEFH